jgi:hypothetical protein
MEFKKTLEKKIRSITQPLETFNQEISTKNPIFQKYGFMKCGNVKSNGGNMLSKYFLFCDFAYLASLQVNSLQIQPTAVKRQVLQV